MYLELMAEGKKEKGEYYVMTVYAELLEQGKKFVLSYADEVWDLGNPEALKKFEEEYPKN